MDTRLITDIVAYWYAIKAWPEPGITPARLDAFEARFGVSLPQAFRVLYERVNGTQGDENLLRFCPLEEIKPLPEEDAIARRTGLVWRERILANAATYFVFADYMIFSHVYAIRLSPAGCADPHPVLWVLSPTQYEEIAPSFDAFLRMYAADPQAVLFPQAVVEES
jgi:hypothetical protein